MYAGLRLGELRALRVADVDAQQVRVQVVAKDGEDRHLPPAGARLEPDLAFGRVPAALDADHVSGEVGREGAALIFGRTPGSPFIANMLQRRADQAWAAANAREREAAEKEGREPELLERITPHELRHSYAALMIAAGVNAKALSTFIGHANNLDHARPLRPPDSGSEAEAARLVESYLAAQGERAAERARVARPVGKPREKDASPGRPETARDDRKTA